VSIPLAALEAVVDASGAAPAIEKLLPAGVRRRQLGVRTLFLGMLLTLADGRPAQLTRVHAVLITLPADDQARLGVIEDRNDGPHQLTYRQVEHTCRLITRALGKDKPDGAPSADLQAVCDRLLEASIPPGHAQLTSALAADWTDIESWSRPPPHGSTGCADPEASWGHRNSNLPGPKGEMFFGYYLSAATMVAEENGPPVPELARRMTLTSCHLDPVRALAAVLTGMPAAGIALGDVIGDSGYAHRDAGAWAIPLRRAGAQLVQDLHPHDRGPRGTHHGAIIANGNLYCPATAGPLLELGPLPPAATSGQTAMHDQQAAELARHKLGRHTADDADGYHRVTCPAAAGKIRCPLRPESMSLGPGPARDPDPARAPAGLLHPADHHRRTRRRSQDPPETRLPGTAMAAVLCPAHRRRAHLRHHQRPRHHQRRPRLVPPDGLNPARALGHLPAGRPQPAHQRRLPGPPRRQRSPCRRRAPPANTEETPRRPRRRIAASSQRANSAPAHPALPRTQARTGRQQRHQTPADRRAQRPATQPETTTTAPDHPGTASSVRPKCEHETRPSVNTSRWS
jgi:hypothetical protein